MYNVIIIARNNRYYIEIRRGHVTITRAESLSSVHVKKIAEIVISTISLSDADKKLLTQSLAVAMRGFKPSPDIKDPF